MSGQGTTQTAKEQAREVAHEGTVAGTHVASVATEQVKDVASEAGHQAKRLLDQARSELIDHAASQQNRLAEQLHSLSHELGSMARTSPQDGLATDLAQQASRQVGTMAHWLSQREPGSLVGELKDFARNKPGTFLAVAAGIGLVAGRLTRGVKAGPPQDSAAGTLSASPAQANISAQVWSSPASTSMPQAVVDDYPTGSERPYPGNDELEKFTAAGNGNTP
ncbi:MAG: hypothetical protein ABI662_07970 [Dermatophilaceae bacterium]